MSRKPLGTPAEIQYADIIGMSRGSAVLLPQYISKVMR